MILYFSATGNSKYVAERIGIETEEEVTSLEKLLKEDSKNLNLKNEKVLGIVCPTYFGGIPHPVEEFLKNITVEFGNGSEMYVFFVTTYGGFTGYIGKQIKKELTGLSINVDSMHSVKMPDTWTPLFDVSDKEENKKILDDSDKKIDEIIKSIINRERGDFLNNKLPALVSKIIYRFYDKSRNTKNLMVNSMCTGCGICEQKCSEGVIKLQENGMPMWTTDKFAMCLRCLHSCPQFSISYKNKTGKNGQYINPRTDI